jgi:hypothetical protein
LAPTVNRSATDVSSGATKHDFEPEGDEPHAKKAKTESILDESHAKKVKTESILDDIK